MRQTANYLLLTALLTAILIYTGVWLPFLADWREKLPRNPNKQYSRRPLSQVRRIVIHHSGTPLDYSPEAIAQYHIGPNHICADGCPEIAYHILLDYRGRAYLVNDLTEVTYHALGNNADTVGICLIGDYNEHQPTRTQLRRLGMLIRYVNLRVGRRLEVVGHRDLKDTTCPGAHIDIGRLQGAIFA